MDETPNLSLPYIMPSQAQKHVTHNEAIRALDVLVQASVVSRQVAGPPAEPSDGDCYLVADGATGAWQGSDGCLAAWQDGGWFIYTPRIGWRVWVEDEAGIVVHDGSQWSALAAGGAAGDGVQQLDTLGINAAADEQNRLVVKSTGILHSHDDTDPNGGDARLTINKAVATDTASLLFQTGYGGRAEMGTAGSDDWRLKVSPDGAQWAEAMTVSSATSHVGFGTDQPAGPVHVSGEDNGVVLQNALDPDADAVWTIAPGRPGNYADHLIISTGSGIDDVSAHQFRLKRDTAPDFQFGIAVADGKRLQSQTSGALAHYMPFDGTRAALAFRGATGSGLAELKITGFYHDGAFHGLDVMTVRAGTDGPQLGIGTSSPQCTLDVSGAVRFGQFEVADLPSASDVGAGAAVYVTDEAGGAVLAFSDGTSWLRSTDRQPVTAAV